LSDDEAVDTSSPEQEDWDFKDTRSVLSVSPPPCIASPVEVGGSTSASSAPVQLKSLNKQEMHGLLDNRMMDLTTIWVHPDDAVPGSVAAFLFELREFLHPTPSVMAILSNLSK